VRSMGVNWRQESVSKPQFRVNSRSLASMGVGAMMQASARVTRTARAGAGGASGSLLHTTDCRENGILYGTGDLCLD